MTIAAFVLGRCDDGLGNRQEVHCLLPEQGYVVVSGLLTSATKWFRQQCDAEDEQA